MTFVETSQRYHNWHNHLLGIPSRHDILLRISPVNIIFTGKILCKNASYGNDLPMQLPPWNIRSDQRTQGHPIVSAHGKPMPGMQFRLWILTGRISIISPRFGLLDWSDMGHQLSQDINSLINSILDEITLLGHSWILPSRLIGSHPGLTHEWKLGVS